MSLTVVAQAATPVSPSRGGSGLKSEVAVGNQSRGVVSPSCSWKWALVKTRCLAALYSRLSSPLLF